MTTTAPPPVNYDPPGVIHSPSGAVIGYNPGGTTSNMDASGKNITITSGGSSDPAKKVAPPPAPKPAIILTSNQSRNNFSSNVNVVKDATANLKSSDPSIVDYLNNNKMSSDFASRSSLAAQYGIPNYVGSSDQNTQLLSAIQSGGSTKTAIAPPVKTTPVADTTTTPPQTAPTDTTKTTDAATDNPDVVDGVDISNLDPVIKQQYKDASVALDQNITDAKAVMDEASSTLQNDPAAQTAVAQIQAKWDQQIILAGARNKILIGAATASSARGGGLQFAPEMTNNFLSDEQQRALARISDLTNSETQAIMTATQSFKNSDIKGLNDSIKAYTEANKQKIDSITKMLDETHKALKEQQDQAKLDAATAKQAISDDIRLSNSLGTTIASTISSEGLKGKDRDAYIQGIADKYGISNIDILTGATVKAEQAQAKADLSAKNTESIIDKRNQPKTPKSSTKGSGTDGGFHYTQDDLDMYSNLLNEGGTDSEGNSYAPRGTSSTDKYVDPGAYNAALNDWIANKGTPLGFAKKFPVKGNINPSSYKLIPAGIRPKTTNSS